MTRPLGTEIVKPVATSGTIARSFPNVREPSFGLITIGPVHQYSTWLLLAYHRGNVYGTNSLGVMNAVYTVVVGIFSLDMFIKTYFYIG